MIRIALCDDQPVFINIIEEAVHSIGIATNMDFEVIAFTTAAEILNAPIDYDILLLDIELDDKQNGLEVGQRLRRRGLTAPIIIVTSHDDCHRQGYKVSPHRYIEKPIKMTEFKEAILTAVAMLQNSNKIIAVKFGGAEILLPIQQIICIENKMRNRLVSMWTDKGICTQETSLSWNMLMEQLPVPQFAFVQRGILINQEYLSARTATSVTLKYVGKVSVSRGYIGEYNKLYQTFVGMED